MVQRRRRHAEPPRADVPGGTAGRLARGRLPLPAAGRRGELWPRPASRQPNHGFTKFLELPAPSLLSEGWLAELRDLLGIAVPGRHRRRSIRDPADGARQHPRRVLARAVRHRRAETRSRLPGPDARCRLTSGNRSRSTASSSTASRRRRRRSRSSCRCTGGSTCSSTSSPSSGTTPTSRPPS